MPKPLLYRIPVSTGKLIGISTPPSNFNWDRFRQVGITHLISLSNDRKFDGLGSVRHLFHHEFQRLEEDQIPTNAALETQQLWHAAHYAWAVLRLGHGVAVQSHDGLQLSALLLIATLRLRGLPLDRAFDLVNTQVKSSGRPEIELPSWHLHQLENPPEELLNLTQA